MKTQRGLILLTVMLLSLFISGATSSAGNSSSGTVPVSAPRIETSASFLAATQDEKTVKLTVRVKDAEGKPISAALVNVYQTRITGASLVARPPDYQQETNIDGVARFEIKVKTGEGLKLYIEAGREDFQTRTEDIDRGTDLPPMILSQITLEPRVRQVDKTQATTTFRLHVVRKDNEEPVESAKITVRSIGTFIPDKYAQTDRNGDAVIVMPLSNDFEVRVSKDLFGQTIQSFRSKEYPTEINHTFFLQKPSGAVVTISVRDEDSGRHVTDADIVMDSKNSAGYYTETTDAAGNATLIVPETGSFAVRISQKYYESLAGEVRLVPGQAEKSFSFALKAKSKKGNDSDSIEVTVLQGDRVERIARYNLPLPGARASVGHNGAETNSSGKATISGEFEGNVEVVVEASGYKRNVKTVRFSDGSQLKGESTALTFLMYPEATDDTIEVSVFTADDGSSMPLAGATVIAGNETATTNANGRAKLTGKFEGSVEVAVEKTGYLRQAKNISASGGKGAAIFTLQAEPDEDSVSITVLAQDPKGGSPSPLAGAEVSANGLTAKTDGSGRATITGNFKDGVEVSAQAKGFDSQTQQVSITQPARTGSANFLLLPEALPLRLIFEVRDAAAPNNQVAGAQVGVGLPVEGTPALAKEATDSRGEATFELKGSADQLSKIRSGLRLSVSFETKTLGHAKIAYFPKPSDITAALLEPSNEARRVTVYLERDWSFLREDIPSLQGRISSLNNDAREAVAKSQSVLDLAAKSPAARGRAESALNELKQAHATFLRARVLSLKSCEEANQIKQSILSFQKEASEKRKQLKMALDEALTLAATCTTSANADRISSGYKNAIRLVGEIGALGPKAMDANQKLSRYAAATRDAGALKRLLQQTRDNIETELAAAKKNAGTADADYDRALELSAGLRDRRSRIQSDLVALNAEYEATKNYSSMPPDLAKQLDGLAQQLGAYNNDVSFGRQPDSNRRDVVRETVAAIEEYKSQADSMAGDISADMCDVQPMDDAVEEIRTLVTNSSFELGLAADLPNKAAECSKRGACMPVIDEIRALLRAGALDSAETRLNQARAQGCDLSALPGGASLVEELDYYKSLNEAVALLKTAQSNCKFQEALDWAARLPESIRNQPSIANTLTQVRSGLDAQQRVQRLRVSARDAVTRGGTVTAAEPLIRQAERIAGPYPCLVEEVSRFRSDYPDTAKSNQGPTDEVPGALVSDRGKNQNPTDKIPGADKGKKETPTDEVPTVLGGITRPLGSRVPPTRPRTKPPTRVSDGPIDEVPGALVSNTDRRPPVKDGSRTRPGNNSDDGGTSSASGGSAGKTVRPCTADEAGLFNKMTGSWKSISMGPNITISGSCEKASGTISYREYCERPDATYNTTLKSYDVTLDGRMEGGSLQLEYKRPGNSDPNTQKGIGSCRAENDGTISCSGLPCNVSAKKQ
jgi:protocatechuate 3,4-dioxygenase beta subunit